ncbi:MAG: hypothetical protein SFV54_05185 [Bryobacteraceae bacterium]|nr:hypothetical protein [Bryobacteraceae bacterium]
MPPCPFSTVPSSGCPDAAETRYQLMRAYSALGEKAKAQEQAQLVKKLRSQKP